MHEAGGGKADGTLYELLGAPPGSSEEEIRAAYREAVAGASSEEVRSRLREALETLLDPEARRAYDRTLGIGSPNVPGPDGSVESTHPEYRVSYVGGGDAGEAPLPITRHFSKPGVRPLEQAPRMAEEAAIATAEAALATVSAYARAQKADRARQARPAEPEIRPNEVFNGELLRQLRLSKGLSLKQLSDRTRIPVRYLENVELERFEELPVAVYLRGILMNLARELGADPMVVARSYLSVAEGKGRQK